MKGCGGSRTPGKVGDAPGEGPGVLVRLRSAGLLARRSLGQHFLHDPRLLSALVEEAGVGPEDRVLEIGTGPGTLTRALALRASAVLTVEVDPAMLAFASRELKDLGNVRFLRSSALGKGPCLSSELLEAVKPIEPFLWVSNLPYNIATPLIVLLCESPLRWTRSSLTVQAEVGERIAATAGEVAYGPVSALVRFWAEVKVGRRIPPGAFWPPPKVQSRVIHLERRAPLGKLSEYESYRAWVKKLFSSRRKQLQKLLREALSERASRSFLLEKAWDPALRPEGLSPQDFLSIARAFPVRSLFQ